MPEIIRVDVVEHVYNPQRDGKIKKAVQTPEQTREKGEKKEAREKARLQARHSARMRSALVYSSMAARKAVQATSTGIGYIIDNSYNRQIFDASVSGNTRQARVLQNEKVVSKAKLDFWTDAVNFGTSVMAGYAINPLLGHIQTVGYISQLSIKLLQQGVAFQEQMRQFLVQMRKEVYETEYNRNRLIHNTYQNRGQGL